MAKSPGDRYPAARMLAEDIEDVLAGRAPRHRAGWVMPALGDPTIASGRLETPAEEELPLILTEDEEDAPPPRRRRRPAAALVAVLTAAVAAYFYLHPADRFFWRFVLQASADGGVASILGGVASALPPPTPMPETARPAAATASPAATPVIAPSLSPVALATPEAFDPPRPILGDPGPAVSPAATSLSAEKTEPGRLVVEFEHHIRRGRLKVWVDDERVLDEEFNGRVVRRILSLQLRKGVVQESLALEPGRHEVRVQVSWDKNVKTSRISGTIAPGATRRLEVEVGRLRGNLGLAWK